MSLLEAVFISIVCFSCVFLGLILCMLFIHGFNKVANKIKWEGGQGHGHHAPTTTPSKAQTGDGAALVAGPKFEPPTPEVLAVIASAIEIDYRLYQGSGHQRLTIRRATPV